MSELVRIPEQEIRCKNLVAGEWRDPTGATSAVESPYNGRIIGQVSDSTSEEVGAAVEAAAAAFAAWRSTPVKERTQFLFRFRELLLRDIDEVSHLAAAEAGKTFGEAKAGVLKGIEVAEFALSQQNLDDAAALEVSRGVTCQYRREPLGVVVGVAPFNFPAMVPMWMFPIAITTGNAFILKPSEKVPLTSQRVGQLMVEAGYPPGVFSVVNGGRSVVEALIDHPKTRALAFVGSTPVAKEVYVRATAHGKRALTLGGAKNHLIVVPDADPSMTVPGVVDSFTGCAGQRCMAASLLLAVGEVDPIIDNVVERAGTIRLGEQMGAIIDRRSLKRIHGILDRAVDEGAEILLDGRKVQPPSRYSDGHWLAPTVLLAKPGMECAQTEIFGPVLTILKVDHLSEALAMENHSPFGNATSVFTTSGAVARFVSENATNGMIGINIGVPVPREPFSFGGTKESRFGHGDITGRSGIEFWSQLKKVTSKWAPQTDRNWMS